MQTEALFDNISPRIKQEIAKARHTIYVAVAWFTDQSLFDALVAKSREGCLVSLITSNDDINQQSSIDYQTAASSTFRVWLLGDAKKELIHHKFCVIDQSVVISGSYNWTNKAKINSENIVITTGNDHLAEQFIKEFHKLCKQFTGSEPQVPGISLDRIIKRLEIIKNLILLEEVEMVGSEAAKLKPHSRQHQFEDIIEAIDSRHFARAVTCIQEFISHNNRLAVWVDEELEASKLKPKHLK